MKKKNESENNGPVRKKSRLRENIEAVLVAVVLALFIRTFIVQAFKIPSGSMKNTLLIGDHILVNKFIYGVKLPFIGKTIIPIKDPKREEIIVFKYPEDPSKDFIKRVIGVAGDVVEIRNRVVYINNAPMGKRAYELHTGDRSGSPLVVRNRDDFGPVRVPPKSVFVLGDNRENSHDSRFWGFVDLEDVKGKAFIIYWSWNKQNHGSILDYVRWKRIGSLLK